MNYVVASDDHFLLNQAIEKIKVTYNACDELNVIDYDYDQGSIDDLLSEAMSVPFFAEYKIIVVNNCTFFKDVGRVKEKDLEKLASYLKDAMVSTILIFVYHGEVSKKLNVVKNILKLCNYQYLPLLKDDEFYRVVKKDLSNSNIVLDNNQWEILKNSLVNNLGLWQLELAKLQSYGTPIMTKDLRKLFPPKISDDVFALTNAILGNDLDKSISLYRDMLVNKVEVLLIMGIMSSNLNLIFKIKYLVENKNSTKQIEDILKINPYRLKCMMSIVYRLSMKDILYYLHSFHLLDYRIKDLRLKNNIEWEFELFLLNLLNR
ncbi:MAG: DNA polymerase III subunit delta [Erysipelotrichaceae bacterium]